MKALVETDPGSWPVLLGQPTGPTEAIDADIATVTGAADKVLRVAATVPYLLLLEFVSGHDAAALPPKLVLRSALLADRHDLGVRTAVVLLHPGADSPRLTGVYECGFPNEAPYLVFRYQVMRVWQLPAERLLTGSIGLLPLAMISAVTEADLPGIIRQVERRLKSERARPQAPSVWSAAYILLGLRYSEAVAAQLLGGVRSMEESVTYQAILRKGRAEGIVEGEAKGALAGALAEAKKVLRLLGEEAFGAPDPRLMRRIERVQDLPQLEQLLKRVRTAANWQELLGEPKSAPAKRRRRPS